MNSQYALLSSIIYHINCSKSSNEIVIWSGLSTNMTRNICLEESMKDLKNKTWKSIVLRNNINKYTLQPPNSENKHSHLWKLEVSFNGESREDRKKQTKNQIL